MSRSNHLERFYTLMNNLKHKLGGYRILSVSNKRTGWPDQGLYFFFEDGERRQESDALRVVRVGTHAVSHGSKATLWDRLIQHRGTLSGGYPGGGKHRTSIFRLHVGSALIECNDYPSESVEQWGQGSDAPDSVYQNEHLIEQEVSDYIGQMPFLWLKAEDEASSDSVRSLIERNSIALLSNANKPSIDPPSDDWLGNHCWNEAVRESGLWNVEHVYGEYDENYLDVLEQYIRAM